MQSSAAVVQKVGAPFTLTEVELQEPAPDEVLVQVAGAGVCHTDIAVQHGHLPFPLPGVLGHEGSGTVVEVGAVVTTVAAGDQVAISFNSCAACPSCAKGQPAYCYKFLEYNFGGVRPGGSVGAHSAEVVFEELVAVRGLTLGATGARGAAVEADRNLITGGDSRHVGTDFYHRSAALMAEYAGQRERQVPVLDRYVGVADAGSGDLHQD